MAGGTAAELAPGSALAGAPWLAVAVADRAPGRRDARIRSAAAIDEATAREAGGPLHRDARRGGLARRRRARARVERLGAIVLAERPLRDPTRPTWPPPLAEGLRQEGLGLLGWTPAARRLRERLASATRARRAVAGRRRRRPARHDRRLGRPQPRRPRPGRRRRGPAGAAALAGRRRPGRPSPPSASGCPAARGSGSTTPTRPRRCWRSGSRRSSAGAQAPLVAGRPVRLHLLSPAGGWPPPRRPAASGAPATRSPRELRGRYPRHPWPEDPAAATPTDAGDAPRPPPRLTGTGRPVRRRGRRNPAGRPCRQTGMSRLAAARAARQPHLVPARPLGAVERPVGVAQGLLDGPVGADDGQAGGERDPEVLVPERLAEPPGQLLPAALLLAAAQEGDHLLTAGARGPVAGPQLPPEWRPKVSSTWSP